MMKSRLQVLFNGHTRHQPDILECSHQAFYRDFVWRSAGEILSSEEDLSPVWPQDPGHEVENGRFPGPIRADQANELSFI